jgi:hypothetical protein
MCIYIYIYKRERERERVCVYVATVSRGFATHHPSSNAPCYVSSNKIKKQQTGETMSGGL